MGLVFLEFRLIAVPLNGGRRTFLSHEDYGPCRRARKLDRRRCGTAIEAQPASGQSSINRCRVVEASNRP